MLRLMYINDTTGASLVFDNEGPVFFLSQKGMDGSGGDAVMVKAPFQYGQTRLFSEISERLITINGCIVTDSLSEEEVLRRRIINTLNPINTGRLYVYGDSHSKVFPGVQVVDGPVFLDQDYTLPDGIVYFNVTCLVPGNFASDVEATVYRLMEVAPAFEFTLEFAPDIVFGQIEKGQAVFNNDGDAEAPLMIEIPGPVNTPCITNLTTGEFIKIFTPIGSDENMIINTSFGNKSVVIVNDRNVTRNAFHYIDLNSTFFQLPIGKSTIQFRAETGNDTANVKISFKRLYLGI